MSMQCTLVLLAADGAPNGQRVDLLSLVDANHPVPQHAHHHHPAANSSTKVFTVNDNDNINGLVITGSTLRKC